MTHSPRSADVRADVGSDDAIEVRAAGGLVLRNDGAHREIAIVHRPHRRDWSFPKGKVEAGESDEDCAVREVEEETGLHCEIEAFAFETRYLDHRLRAKEVRYYLMRIVSGRFKANDEVDELRFVPLKEATELLTYERDREIAQALLGP